MRKTIKIPRQYISRLTQHKRDMSAEYHPLQSCVLIELTLTSYRTGESFASLRAQYRVGNPRTSYGPETSLLVASILTIAISSSFSCKGKHGTVGLNLIKWLQISSLWFIPKWTVKSASGEMQVQLLGLCCMGFVHLDNAVIPWTPPSLRIHSICLANHYSI
jgi:hypothetical protein